jgi:hypothetical protein
MSMPVIRPVGPTSAAAAKEIEDPVADPGVCQVEEVPDAGEGIEGLGRDQVQQLGGVAQACGQRPAHLEVVAAVWFLRHLAVHVLDPLLQVRDVELH